MGSQTELVANIPMKPSTASLRTHWEAQKSGRHALELLASSVIGCTETALLADGFRPDLLAGLVRNGLASLDVERVRELGGSRSAGYGSAKPGAE